MSEVQLTGVALFGDPYVDHSSKINMITVKSTRNSVTVPPTLGNPIETTKAGAWRYEVELQFTDSVAASSFWADLWDAIESDSAEVEFLAGTTSASVGTADAPVFSGTFVATALDTMAEAGGLRQQTQTYPVTSDGITKSNGS